MKVSKKILTLFTVTLIIGLLTVGTVSKATNSFIKFQPPTEGEWIIELLNGAQSISSLLADVGFDSDVDDDPYYDNGTK